MGHARLPDLMQNEQFTQAMFLLFKDLQENLIPDLQTFLGRYNQIMMDFRQMHRYGESDNNDRAGLLKFMTEVASYNEGSTTAEPGHRKKIDSSSQTVNKGSIVEQLSRTFKAGPVAQKTRQLFYGENDKLVDDNTLFDNLKKSANNMANRFPTAPNTEQARPKVDEQRILEWNHRQARLAAMLVSHTEITDYIHSIEDVYDQPLVGQTLIMGTPVSLLEILTETSHHFRMASGAGSRELINTADHIDELLPSSQNPQGHPEFMKIVHSIDELESYAVLMQSGILNKDKTEKEREKCLALVACLKACMIDYVKDNRFRSTDKKVLSELNNELMVKMRSYIENTEMKIEPRSVFLPALKNILSCVVGWFNKSSAEKVKSSNLFKPEREKIIQKMSSEAQAYLDFAILLQEKNASSNTKPAKPLKDKINAMEKTLAPAIEKRLMIEAISEHANCVKKSIEEAKLKHTGRLEALVSPQPEPKKQTETWAEWTKRIGPKVAVGTALTLAVTGAVLYFGGWLGTAAITHPSSHPVAGLLASGSELVIWRSNAADLLPTDTTHVAATARVPTGSMYSAPTSVIQYMASNQAVSIFHGLMVRAANQTENLSRAVGLYMGKS